MLNTKQCKSCNTIKDLSEFYKSKQTRDGYIAKCKSCQSEYVKTYRQNNTQKMRDFANKSYAKHKNRINAYNNQYNKDNKEKMDKWKKQYYLDNKDEINRHRRKYHHENKNNEEYILSKKNSSQKRRSLKISTSNGTIPSNIYYPLNKELKELLGLQLNKCYKCGICLSKGKHLDHHVPLSKGGTHTLDNVVFLCPTCNLEKSNKLPKKLLLIG